MIAEATTIFISCPEICFFTTLALPTPFEIKIGTFKAKVFLNFQDDYSTAFISIVILFEIDTTSLF
jgi:hypothetical protein